MPNLVTSLGAGYFRDFFNGAIFYYEGKAHRVTGADQRTVQAVRLSDGHAVLVPNAFFLGFKNFEYPTLGYRRLGPDVVAYLSRIQSTHRGLRQQSINVDYSPITSRLASQYLIPNPAGYNAYAGQKVFEPEWDTAANIPELLAGDRTSVVLNEHVIVEPSVNAHVDWYSIYFNQALVGNMNSRGSASFGNKKYEKLITPLLRAA